ncbi:glycosyltransferase [Firmicutes bacterium CAG:582]|nr:glycosyltransferase [Firmicutes bacterium CAG:582]
MKLVSINTVCNGSTGKIMGSISREARNDGFEVFCIYGRRKGYTDIPCKKIGRPFSFLYHVFITTIFDAHGHGSYFKTKELVRELKKINPDIIHLHNIHGYYINYKILFDYLRNEYQGKIFWTLHDCLPMTGHCAYFDYIHCDRWKMGCHDCPNKKKYPISLVFDRSKKNYEEKKKLFTDPRITIITPSIWLQDIVSKSFLKICNVKTINNGINLEIFKPKKDETIYDKYNIPKDKKVILGVASIWEKRKGFDDFLSLADKISDEYVIVLVGLNDRQTKEVENYRNIIPIKRTENQVDLATLYSLSYCLLNPTYEDNYPTVNIEALACHTRVVCYDTGGCVEQAKNRNVYLIKKQGKEENIKNILKTIYSLKEYQEYDTSIYSDKLFAKKIIEEYRK